MSQFGKAWKNPDNLPESVLAHVGALARRRTGKNKMHATATWFDYMRFQSKKEAKHYRELKLRVLAGEVRYFLRQVPIHLPGMIYRVDFQEFHADGSVHYVDVKGYATPEFLKKKRRVEQYYPIIIETT